MCGLTGIVHLDFRPVDFRILKQMSDVQKHRGPDDQGLVGFSFKSDVLAPVNFHSEKKINNLFHGGIGFNRLSILDLSMNGHQPMISDNGKVVIAYNGETYNAFHFKRELEKNGIRFKSRTDTEVLLSLYQKYGIDRLLEMANGMFAFCIVDLGKKIIYLARDHAGIKPLYWSKCGETILFASEIKSFLHNPEFKAEIELDHLDEYLYYKYCAFDRTLFKNVFQIPPGHYIQITTTNVKRIKYWEPNLEENLLPPLKNSIHKLEQALIRSVKSQLISDVKLGCQLSGGIDSSLVTTYASMNFKANMDTFSVIIENKDFSEEKYMDQVIELANLFSHKFLMTPKIFFENLVPATWHSDVPLPIPQAVGIKWLAKNTSEYVTVLLSGEGSDELMGGYSQFYNLAFRLKNSLVLRMSSRIPVKGKKIQRKYLTEYKKDNYFIQYRSGIHLFDFMEFRPEANLEMIYEQRKQLVPNHNDLLKSMRIYDMRTWMVNLLNIQDKMTMAHSIENRVPFLDRDIINLVLSLPSHFFIRSSYNPFKYNSVKKNTKFLLKKIALKYYDDAFVFRSKNGFNQPIKDYFNYPAFNEMVKDQLLPGIRNKGIFDYEKLIYYWDNREKNIFPSLMPLLWNCISFEIWAQEFIDKKFTV